MARKAIEMPKFKSESEEADWWASAAGRDFLSERSRALEESGVKPVGSRLVARQRKPGGFSLRAGVNIVGSRADNALRQRRVP
jgi:hypothetical protein